MKVLSKKNWLELIASMSATTLGVDVPNVKMSLLHDSKHNLSKDISLANSYYLKGQHLKAIKIYTQIMGRGKRRTELNEDMYGLSNIYFTRGFEEFFKRKFKKTLKYFQYGFMIYPDCYAMWECLIQMYFLNYMDHQKKIDYTEIKKKFFSYNSTEEERMDDIKEASDKRRIAIDFFNDTCKQRNADHSSDIGKILNNVVAQIEGIMYKCLLNKSRIKGNTIKDITFTAAAKIAEIFCRFKFQYFITVTNSEPTIKINEEYIKLENRGWVLFYILADQLRNDCFNCKFYDKNIITAGICSSKDLTTKLADARKKGIWLSMGDTRNTSSDDICTIVKNIRDKLKHTFKDKDKEIRDLIHNITQKGYILNNNPAKIEIVINTK